MKKTASVIASLCFLFSGGCASQDDVVDSVLGAISDWAESAFSSEDSDIPEQADPQAQSGDAFVTWDPELHPDYYTVLGEAEVTYDVNEGEVGYCETDSLGRAQCAYGLLTTQTRADAKAQGRQQITVDPAGWGKNFETTIPSTRANVKDYRGWVWNRSHLLADSLGGSAELENLVTGTRTQNVGLSNNSGGMAYTENIARDYLDDPASASCPLYYAATPNYKGPNLLPVTVTVDIKSCDSKINERVLVFNSAQGHDIDYATGIATVR